MMRTTFWPTRRRSPRLSNNNTETNLTGTRARFVLGTTGFFVRGYDPRDFRSRRTGHEVTPLGIYGFISERVPCSRSRVRCTHVPEYDERVAIYYPIVIIVRRTAETLKLIKKKKKVKRETRKKNRIYGAKSNLREQTDPLLNPCLRLSRRVARVHRIRSATRRRARAFNNNRNAFAPAQRGHPKGVHVTTPTCRVHLVVQARRKYRTKRGNKLIAFIIDGINSYSRTATGARPRRIITVSPGRTRTGRRRFHTHAHYRTRSGSWHVITRAP